MGRPALLLHENLQERRRLGFHQTSLFPCQGSTRGGTAPQRRTVSPASYCSGPDCGGRNRPGRQIGGGSLAARRGGRHGIHRGRHGTHLRSQDRLDGRRTDEDVGRIQRRHLGTGGILPQSAADPLGRRPCNLDKNRRPPAQHAPAGLDADEQANQDYGRNDLPVCAAGLPAGALLHQERTGRPLHEIPVSAAIRRNHAETPRERSLAQGIHRQIQRPDYRSARPRPLQLRNIGPAEERLLHLEQDAAQTNSVRGNLRPFRHPNRIQTAAVPVGKDPVLANLLDHHGYLHPQARPPARLDFDAQGQRLRSAPLDGHGTRRGMGRSTDPHPTHGRHRRTRIRGPLEIQTRDDLAGRRRIRQVAETNPDGAEQPDGKRSRLPGQLQVIAIYI